MNASRRQLFGLGGAALLAVSGCSPDRPADGQPTGPSAPGTGGADPTSPSPTPTPTPSPTPTGPAEPGTPEDLVTGLTTPWGLVRLDDGSLLVSERDTAKIKRVTEGTPATVTEVAEVQPTSEGGLLGIALSPDGDQLFCYHTTNSDNRIVRFRWDGEELSDPKVVLDGIPHAPIHDGGRLRFGPDGHLYASTGDASRRSLAQDTSSLAGKILRITTDGEPAPGNPFDNEVWSYGHRNVQGLAFDDDGRLWASEFGDQTEDELNLITKGANYGWPEIEGDETTMEGRTNPVRVWPTSEASPSGLAFTAGSLWMGALRGQRLWQIPLTDGKAGKPVDHFHGEYGRLRSVLAIDGALLVATSNTDGRGDVRKGDDRILRIPFE